MIRIIVAVSKDGFIGKGNDIPWQVPSDVKHFEKTTIGHAVIMGRKTWESIDDKYRPLSGRRNIVITHQENYMALGAEIAPSLASALELARSNPSQDIFIAGGGEIYKQAMKQNLADELIVTRVEKTIGDGDARFPEIDSRRWACVQVVEGMPSKKDECRFIFETYRRIC